MEQFHLRQATVHGWLLFPDKGGAGMFSKRLMQILAILLVTGMLLSLGVIVLFSR